ncbi:MAG TPA: FAD-linked oxidase C-terminal domain-containing protein [Rubrobacteraceae bacterium]|nr:FAD-linked oxidase C-terminal domain-containing protein [Rubrobacteraceae bacterium]
MTDTVKREGYSLNDRQRMNLNALLLQSELRDAVKGEVRFDAGYRAAYSTDSSNYRQAPLGVVVPRDPDDVVAALAVCRRHRVPVTPRGCGTSLAGQGTNAAVVFDVSRYMREIVEVDPEKKIARVQPGVIRDQLAKPLEAEHGLSFPPDTSTHAYATFGGMIGNNSCGAHSVMTGRTSDNVEEMDVVLYDGTRMRVGATSEEELERIIQEGGRKGEIYARLRDLRDRYGDRIRERYPQIPRRVSGYNLDELLPEKGFNVARALVGTEGTCAFVLEATVRLTPWPPARSILVLGYPSIFEAADHVPEVMSHAPMSCEAIDRELIDDMLRQGMHESEVPLLPDGDGWLIVEFGAKTREESDARAREVMEALERDETTPRMRLFDDETEEAKLWSVRESGLGATAYYPGGADHYEGWEDTAVPPEKFGHYLRDFQDLLDRYGYNTAMYGHFGQGLVHCRINFDLKSARGIRHWREFLDEAADLVVRYGGSLSGEHGDGQSRAELLGKMYGPELLRAFREFKAIWDPENKMNPHKIVEPYRITENLKLGADYDPPNVDTHFAYPQDGGSFAHAAVRCVGAGKCRDTSTGTMCPSYMVTLDEEYTTRGRARVLFEMLRGETIKDGFKSDEVFDSLDLCLSCKGCKGDCPVNVDMATYKAEFLSKYYESRIRPRYAYTMGLIMFHARLAQYVPRLANFVTHAPVLKDVVRKAGGITTEREMPPFATQTFKTWFEERGGAANPAGPPVVLFPDTFNNFLHPETAKAATEVLEAAGYQVIVPQQFLCCGRPLFDYGMLDTAKVFFDRLIDGLRPYVREGVPIVGLEPSCVAAFRDELPNMMPNDEDARRLSRDILTLSEFLVQEAKHYDPPKLNRKAIVHGHCHQKAIMGMSAEQQLYEKMGLDYEVLDSGCCGLAGSWGFEEDKYDLSMKIGARRLFPAARDADTDTLVISDGFSCKTQLQQGTDRRALHTAQVVKMALDHGAGGAPRGERPESGYPDVILDGARPDLKTAAVAGAALALGAAALWVFRGRR